MKKFIQAFLTFSFLITITPSLAFAQINRHIDLPQNELGDLAGSTAIPASQATNITGSPYHFNEFSNGKVTLRDGRTTETLQMNFNSYENRVEYTHGTTVMALDSDKIKEFKIVTPAGEHHFVKGLEARRLDSDDFVELMVDGEVNLFAKHSTSFQENVATYGTATQEDEYISDTTYYMKVGEQSAERLRRLRERTILRNLDSHRDEIKSYAESNDLIFSEPEDLTKILAHYNSLVMN